MVRASHPTLLLCFCLRDCGIASRCARPSLPPSRPAVSVLVARRSAGLWRNNAIFR
ncbi:hypothetical protein PF005_g13277 [Phytophthora fragariae]|uniref:RxLR effector protein n=1 Tax=Phytophthora fragariae TaxID=53985 RepID=A0A6A3TIJ5_9STRA|nr:hypothetical protein PF009_g23986 [Phytophthora fragariae]KAE9136867.1 hypothetical protein PF006_g14301 [Phytophthora fragariae]KAE9205752.1 hypothetical protein PF005_g13277 [Phytophthora fragariae]KAE9286458.1 hypothetical protein PF001_g21436 [Phytophthora fragariae]